MPPAGLGAAVLAWRANRPRDETDDCQPDEGQGPVSAGRGLSSDALACTRGVAGSSSPSPTEDLVRPGVRFRLVGADPRSQPEGLMPPGGLRPMGW